MQAESDRRHDLMANAVPRSNRSTISLLHQLSEMDIDDRIEQLAERIISTLDALGRGLPTYPYLIFFLKIMSPKT